MFERLYEDPVRYGEDAAAKVVAMVGDLDELRAIAARPRWTETIVAGFGKRRVLELAAFFVSDGVSQSDIDKLFEMYAKDWLRKYESAAQRRLEGAIAELEGDDDGGNAAE